jgi:hypothetical protein
MFSPISLAKKLAFSTLIKAEIVQNLIITLVFEKNADCFAESCRKSQKIVIITPTPGQQQVSSDAKKIAGIGSSRFARSGWRRTC